MKRIHDKVLRNRFIKFIYKGKTYITISRGEIGWFLSWLPEIGWAGALLIWFGVEITRKQALLFFPVFLFFLLFFGWFWRWSGIYVVERKIHANVDPVEQKILQAAEIIIENEEINKRKNNGKTK